MSAVSAADAVLVDEVIVGLSSVDVGDAAGVVAVITLVTICGGSASPVTVGYTIVGVMVRVSAAAVLEVWRVTSADESAVVEGMTTVELGTGVIVEDEEGVEPRGALDEGSLDLDASLETVPEEAVEVEVKVEGVVTRGV